MKIINWKPDLKITPPCIIAGMPNEIYHNDKEYLSSTGLRLFDRSPAHLYCAEPYDQTRAMQIGSAIHCAILEPDVFEREYLLLQDVKDRRSAIYKDALKIHSEDKVLISHEINSVTGAAEAVLLNDDYQSQYASVKKYTELSFFAVDQETGVKIKCRFDIITEDGKALDIKKTQDVREFQFMRAIAIYDYHIQQAFYERVYQCATSNELQDFAFLAIEEKSPNSNRIYRIDDLSMQLAHKKVSKILNKFKNQKDRTEGITLNETYITLPEWKLAELEDEVL
jgi:hypothetical protein